MTLVSWQALWEAKTLHPGAVLRLWTHCLVRTHKTQQGKTGQSTKAIAQPLNLLTPFPYAANIPVGFRTWAA